ncbi:hypothetical protein G6F37_005496 [Rhizopus arrhizus]|nr:hypothetical protein G6F37_005496 [Rhizopus arrhizus]
MTLHKEDTTDVDAIQVHSAKDLEHEFSEMLKCYNDKETEHNWEARERSITQIRGFLRGNAPEAYLDVLVHGIRNMVDGIIKAVESLRTQLAVKALLLVGDIGIYVGKHLDTYINDQLLMCMMRCAGLTKKMVATASLQATITFLRHANFYPKFVNMLSLAINDKNTQVRLYTMQYCKTLLQTHAYRDHTRVIMDRTNCTDQFEVIINKGLNDATPAVREVCREAFWEFWEHWRDRGEYFLKQLPSTAQKQLEKSKTSNTKPTRNLNSPTNSSGSLRASSSLGRHNLSPSNSTLSTGSTGSVDTTKPFRQNGSPHLFRYGSPPTVPSQLYDSPSPPPSISPNRKTRVPGLNKKKSAVGLNKRKAPSLFALLNNEDYNLRIDGIHQVAKKLGMYPYTPTPNLELIDLETQPAIDGETLKTIILQQFEEPSDILVYETLSSWEGVTCVMLRLLNFEEYIPRLILDAHTDEISARRSELNRQIQGKLALRRAKLFLQQQQHAGLADGLFTNLVQFGGFGNTTQRMPAGKRDIYKLPANRRKLTKEFLVWMDELLRPLIGLEVDVEEEAWEGVPEEYRHMGRSAAAGWFESDANVHQCLNVLLPLVTTYNSGSLWHGPLVAFIKHLRLLNQQLFDSVTAAYDEYSVNKICRILGIRLDSPPSVERPPAVSVAEPVNALESLPEMTKNEEQVIKEQEQQVPTVIEEPVEIDEAEDEFIGRKEFDKRELEVIKEHGEEEHGEDEDTEEKHCIEDNEEKQDDTVKKDSEEPLMNKEDVSMHLSTKENEQKAPMLTDDDKPVKVEQKTPDLTDVVYDRRLEEDDRGRTKSPIPNYFESNMVPPLTSNFPDNHVTDSNYYESGPMLYPTHGASERSTPISTTDGSTSPQQSPAIQFQISEPNKDKYPEPKFVPFFYPEKVNYPCAVFQSNARSTAGSVRGGKDKTALLYALIDKLKSSSIQPSDNVNTFRKLTGLLKEVPIRRRWDQGGSEENGNETWAGANGDGGNFVELVQSILLHLDTPTDKRTISALECTRQLAVTQSGLFKFFERKSNDKGMTVESLLTEKLLELRSNENPTICIAAEDALDAVLSTLTPPTAFEMLMAFIVYRSTIAPYDDQTISGNRYHPVGSALTYVARSVRELHDVFYIEEWLTKGAVNAFFKGMNSPLVSVRKSCVEAIVAFHEIIHDTIYSCLEDLREDQINLIRHYVTKSLKKKASLRNMRETHQFL